MNVVEKATSDVRKRLAEKRDEAISSGARCSDLRAERDKTTDERKALWRQEQDLNDAQRTVGDEMDRARRSLQHSTSRHQWEAISAVRKIAEEQHIKGYYGLVRDTRASLNRNCW